MPRRPSTPTPAPRAPRYVAFRGTARIAAGDPAALVRAIFREGGDRRQGAVLAFDARTSEALELDLRGSLEEALARLAPGGEPRRGPGRPRLGVVARELTLLPRHWEWLTRQPGGASAAVRRLVDQARADSEADRAGRRRAAQDSAYRFMSAMLGNEPDFEEATRAFFARDAARFTALSARWPKDLRDHARRLARAAFDPT